MKALKWFAEWGIVVVVVALCLLAMAVVFIRGG
jgi:hypothetical protein